MAKRPVEEKWNLSWERDGDEATFTLETDRGEREIKCPTNQGKVVKDVLCGKEYKLPDRISEVCEGLPVVDIGAHIGSANVYFDEVLHPSKIMSCEPHPVCLKYLENNVNGITHIVPAAVTNHRQGATLNCPSGLKLEGIKDTSKKLGLCMASIAGNKCYFHGQGESDLESTPVDTVLGCDVMATIGDGEIGLVKIDAELSEVNILMSMEKHLDRVLVFFIEYHSDMLRRQCDAILRDFEPFVYEGRLRQGVVGYVHRRIADNIESYF